jgi:hypothetical protein
MDTFQITQKVVDGKILIDLPKEFNNKEVKVTISAESEFGDEEHWAGLPAHKKVELLKTFMGADKFPSVKVGKYDVYYQ